MKIQDCKSAKLLSILTVKLQMFEIITSVKIQNTKFVKKKNTEKYLKKKLNYVNKWGQPFSILQCLIYLW